MAGLDEERARGRKGGRPSRLTLAQQKAAVSMVKSNDMTVTEVAQHFNVSRSTLYNLVASSRTVA